MSAHLLAIFGRAGIDAATVVAIGALFGPAQVAARICELVGTSNNVRGHKFGLGPVFDCLPGFFFRPLLRL
jgi:hypothetical protein